MRKLLHYFSPFEAVLLLTSYTLLLVSFFIFGGNGVVSLIASMIGITALVFCAKGNPAGQVLIIIFSAMYAYVSISLRYYGEAITYLGMSAPMALWALISWLRNYDKEKAEVKVGKLGRGEIFFLIPLTAAVTFAFYFILRAFGTANLLPSTVSVATSFFAVYLTARRSPYFALAYTLNDIVLIVLWSMAIPKDIGCVSVVICFFVFLFSDLYSFTCWNRRKKKQLARTS